MKTYWSDEREGCWTRVDFVGNQVRVFLSKNHAAGVLVGAAAFAMLLASFAQHWFQLPEVSWWLAAALFPVFYLRFSKYNRDRTANLPLLLEAEGGCSSEGFARVILFSEVAAVVVKENTQRDHVEESALAQIYLDLFSDEFGVLIHQTHLHRSEHAIQLAEGVARHIGAVFQNQLLTQ